METPIDNLFITGWVLFHEHELEKMSHDDIAGYLAGKYLSPYFPSFDLVELSERFDIDDADRICEWHNDSRFGMNITFLYYASTMSPETGGSISLRNLSTDDYEQIYPIAGTLVMMSQKQGIEHKAEICKIRRHMFNIDFDVEGF